MPGLSYHSACAQVEKRLNRDSHFNTGTTFDSSKRSDIVQPPKVILCPLNPRKHKPCKPSYSQASWMKHTREDEYKNLQICNWPLNPTSSCPTQRNIENEEGDTDLATMVHDFIENGCYECEYDGSDWDNSSPNPEMLCRNLLQVLSSAINPFERDLKSVVEVMLSTHTVEDIACKAENTQCKSGCVRRFVAYHLKSLRYNAAICNIKWQNSGKVPGGEYEYIDVLYSDDGYANGDRIVIDLDFQSQFEIARPTQPYLTALKLLPVIFVGPWKKLEEILGLMSEAAKYSLKQNSMHLPPWRTLEYMCAKWLTPCERKVYEISSSLFEAHSNQRQTLEQDYALDSAESNQCWELVKHLKASHHKADNDKKNCNLKNCSYRVGKHFIRNKSSAW